MEMDGVINVLTQISTKHINSMQESDNPEEAFHLRHFNNIQISTLLKKKSITNILK